MARRQQFFRPCWLAAFTLFACGLIPRSAQGDKPYFITYNHEMEEPGSLELSLWPVVGLPQRGQNYLGAWAEFEYGAKAWWTTEFYLDGQSTRRDSMVFTGFRWENRFRPLMREHWINPVLYFEYESLNGADKTLLEVVNHDSVDDLVIGNDQARKEHKHEMEGKLILSSNFKGWNVSENFIAEKNLNNNPWEFGYAAGISRPLALAATPRPCSFCRENFKAGIEFYGGLGTRHKFGTTATSHYAGPLLVWELPDGLSLRVSPTVGLNKNSVRGMIRLGVTWELPGFGRRARRLFH